MTIEDILLNNELIGDSEREWQGIDLMEEIASNCEGFLQEEAVVGETGRIWIFSKEGNRIETGFYVK